VAFAYQRSVACKPARRGFAATNVGMPNDPPARTNIGVVVFMAEKAPRPGQCAEAKLDASPANAENMI
jgi:hypothetical protein